MNQLALLAALGAAALIFAIVLLVAGLVGRVVDPAQARPSSHRLRDPRLRRLILIAVLATVLTLAVTRWPVAAIAVGLAVLGLPRLITGRAATERIRKLEALEQWTRRLADLLTATHTLEQAIVRSSARNVPEAVAGSVEALARRVRLAQVPAEQALRMFADELNDPVGDRIAATLILVSRRRGAGAALVLARLAEMVARDVNDRREVEAARAEHRTTVRWIIAILVLFCAAAMWQHEYVAPYGTALGQMVLAVVAGFYAIALFWLHRLSNATPGARLLAGEGKWK